MLEHHVCSLELARRLKELGVKQESFFYWMDGELCCNSPAKNIWINDDKIIEFDSPFEDRIFPKEILSAFTASELLELLPSRITINEQLKAMYLFKDEHGNVNIKYEGWNLKEEDNLLFCDKNMADAMSKALIHLLENNLIEL
jgi:hypothetical protein